MRKNSNDMKHCGVYLIRLKKKKNPYTLDLGLTNCPPLSPPFALQPYVNSLRQNISLKISQISKNGKKKSILFFFFFCI